MDARADGIEAQLDRAIYDDDPDARERLAERIANLEGRQERMKVVNAGVRRVMKQDGAVTFAALQAELGLTDSETDDLRRVARFNGSAGYPAYALSNNRGNLRRYQERLKALDPTARSTMRYYYAAKYGGTCEVCGLAVEKGAPMYYDRADQTVRHEACYKPAVAS